MKTRTQKVFLWLFIVTWCIDWVLKIGFMTDNEVVGRFITMFEANPWVLLLLFGASPAFFLQLYTIRLEKKKILRGLPSILYVGVSILLWLIILVSNQLDPYNQYSVILYLLSLTILWPRAIGAVIAVFVDWICKIIRKFA